MLRNPTRTALSSIEMPEPARGAVAEPDAAPSCVRWDGGDLPGGQRARRTAVTRWSRQLVADSIAPQSRRVLTTARKDALMSGVRTLRRARHASRAKLTIERSTARVVCLIIAALAPSMIATAAPPNAEAASYTVWACANGSGAPLSVGSWVRAMDAGLADVQATCAEPSAPVGAFLARARAASGDRPGNAGWVVAATPGTRITSLDVWWSWQVLPSSARGAIRVYALGNAFLDPTGATDPFDGTGRCCNDSAFVVQKTGAFGAITTSNPSVAFSRLNHQSFPQLRVLNRRGTPLVGLSAACVSACSSGEAVAQYQAYRVKTVVEDAAAPTGKADGLRDGLRVGAGTPIEATASDGGGGVREVTLRVDGNVVQRVSGGADCTDVDPSNADPLEYNLMKPCPNSLTGLLTLSAAQMPDNEPHQVTAVATDAAGQDTVLSSARAALAAPGGFYDPKNGFYNPDLRVEGGGKANGSNAGTRTKLTLGFVRGRRTAKRRTVRYSTPARIRGRVTTAGKKPVRGARVWLASRVRSGQWRIARKPLITSRNGVVSARLPARSPSRKVRLVYFPSTTSNTDARSPSGDLRVQATTTIQSDQGGYRNGDTLTFTGQVIKKHLIDKKSVYLQAIVRGKWRTFATTEADSQGRWRMTHRFEATRRPTRYTFRAVVPAQTGYDWATGHSRSVRVLVTP